jgi:hypothetical protein
MDSLKTQIEGRVGKRTEDSQVAEAPSPTERKRLNGRELQADFSCGSACLVEEA